MSRYISKSLWLLTFSVVICCLIYPLALWAIGQTLFPFEANGSMLTGPDGKPVGSRLIAQPFTKDEYFQPRPSAASYDGSASASSALAASNYMLRNRVAQADYVADQLLLRQSQLQFQKSMAQVRVDVKNAVIGLQQARARYETAVATRSLGQQTLEAEQNRFRFGESTIATVVQAQRDLAADQSAEVQSMANYTHAKINFDQSVGRTLSVNNVSMEEAMSGHVSRESILPATLPTPPPAPVPGEKK